MLLVISLLIRTGAAQEARCYFNWASPLVNDLRPVQLNFYPIGQPEKNIDSLIITIPIIYNLPITTAAEAQLTVNRDYTKTDWSSSTDFAMTIDIPNQVFRISLTQLKAFKPGKDSGSLQISIGFLLRGSSFSQSLDTSLFTCGSYNTGVLVESDPTVTITSVQTETKFNIEPTPSITQMAVSTNIGGSVTIKSGEAGLNPVNLVLTYVLSQKFNQLSWITLQVPKANVRYNTKKNDGKAISLITELNKNGMTFKIDGTQYVVQASKTLYTVGSGYLNDEWSFTTVYAGTPEYPAGTKIEISVPITNPPLVDTILLDESNPTTNFYWKLKIFTEVGTNGTPITNPTTQANLVEEALQPPSSGLTTSSPKQTSGTSAQIMGAADGFGVSGATYQFEFMVRNPVPFEGIMVVKVPVGVVVPGNSVKDFSMTCTLGCGNAAGAVFTYDPSSRAITIANAFGSYIPAGQTVKLSITGWTNPLDNNSYSFSIATKAVIGTKTYDIENFDGNMSIKATSGICYVQDIFVTDKDTRVYAYPKSYTIKVFCNHALLSGYGLQVVLPKDYIVKDQSCAFTLKGIESSSRYFCRTTPTTNTIVVNNFVSVTIPPQTLMTFTLDSIINPGTTGTTRAITISTLDKVQQQIDVGKFTLNAGYFTTGNITLFTVTPQDASVGLYPVKYNFRLIPNGEIERYSYLSIRLPEEIVILDENDFETKCGESLFGITNKLISCIVTNGGRTILIKDGFINVGTTNLTDSDGLYFPPDIGFTLDNFQNPRTAGTTGPWNITIFSNKDKELYYWQQAASPTIRVSGISQPQYIMPTFENRQNGALTWIEFLVTTTGGLHEGDKIVVKLPFGWQFTQNSTVVGRSNNLANTMNYVSGSVDKRQIEFGVRMSYRRRLRQDRYGYEFLNEHDRQLANIESGFGFQFRITDVKNYDSFRPSDSSMEYYVYSSSGILFEEKTSGMILVNNQTGLLSQYKNGILPGDFRTNFETNYTLTLQVENFEKNMKIILQLPSEVDFAKDNPSCYGLSGVDPTELTCIVDRKKKTITFPNSMEFAVSNPGKMSFSIEKLKNPSENIITSSFMIKTETFDGFPMDEINNAITVNFFCAYPCASCDNSSPTTCQSCYQTAVERYFYNSKCLTECESGMVETFDLTCEYCISPCVTCDTGPRECLTCIDGYDVVDKKCREQVSWYFPFVIIAMIFFILISISEIVTKRVSNFKEAVIAFWSIPEVFAWVCVTWFMWHRQGQQYTTGLAAIACLLYVLINIVHAIIHPRYMVPNTLYSYKLLLTNYKCGTFVARAISYLFSFKFSLILVSHFFNAPSLKGDYSAMNWKQFNRFSLVFVFLPYAVMMTSCVYFVLSDGFFSYPGFVAVEVIFLSTIMTMLMLIDAISAVKCKTVGKSKTNKAVKVATGADYESDEDEMNLRKEVSKTVKVTRIKANTDKNAFDMDGDENGKKTKGGGEEFGADGDEYGSELDSVTELKKQNHSLTRKRPTSEHSYNSKFSQQTQIMNEEARKQIAMLEELAHQMREEKRLLQLDKERIEREKQLLNEERQQSKYHLENYMEDYQRQTTALSNQVRQMERQKLQLVQQVEEKLSEGAKANQLLSQKVLEAQRQKQILANQNIRKNFRDFEGEMEDYEPVEEENSEDAQSSVADIVDGAQLPVKAAFGQIDYYRHIEGDDQQWLQQITPRAGGDSMLGQHDMEDEMMINMMKNDTAHYEIASIPPSRYDDQLENGVVEAEFQEIESQMEAVQSEMYQQRSDAEMEINSSIEEKDAVVQEWFEPERAIFSQLGDRLEQTNSFEFFSNVHNPVFEALPRLPTRHGQEQRYFVSVPPQAGEGDKRDQLESGITEFFKQEPPTYGEVLEEGEMERQATAQHFFKPEKAIQGDADDIQRQGVATPLEYLQRYPHYFNNDVEKHSDKETGVVRLFNQEVAILEDASNMARSNKGSELIYQERSNAFIDRDLNDSISRTGTEQQYFNREEAIFAQDKSVKGKNRTDTEFFKQDEAIRGDVYSQDKSLAATQQNYFQNVDRVELGRPDSYDQYKSDIPVDYMNKSEMDKARTRNAGPATPITDRQAEPVDYLNKSEAEYGRQSSIQNKDATGMQFFEAEKNPEFGRGEQYTRNREEEREYNPTPVEDSISRSESSEGGIANHAPFASTNAFKAGQAQQQVPYQSYGPNQSQPSYQGSNPYFDPNVQQVKKVLQKNPNARQFEEDQRRELQNGVPEASLLESPQKRATMKRQPQNAQNAQNVLQPQHAQMHQQFAHMQPPQKKTILYSDKSETSVEDLMDDTPSNYNIQNGRFEGKSLGLKALLIHAKNYQNQTFDPDSQSRPEMLQGLAGLADLQNRSPQHARPGNGLLAPGMVGAQKGIIGSQNDERQFVNNLYQTNISTGQASANNEWRAGGPMAGQRVPVIGEESGDDSMQPRNNRSYVRTNKQFVEDPRNAQTQGARQMPNIQPASRSPNVQQQNQRGRGAPRVTKNNYFGGSAT